MFKWIRGFCSGVLLTIYASSIGLMAVYIWLIKDTRPSSRRKVNYSAYYVRNKENKV